MISIIICSRNNLVNNLLLDNIGRTIGVEYEIIQIDNSETKYSICEAYNKGIRDSKFDILLFIHDDVEFVTKNFGIELLKIFQIDNKIGIVGVAGSKYKTKAPSTWSETNEDAKVINIIQVNENEEKLFHSGLNNSTIENVVCIDGVFIAMKKSLNLHFNEAIRGFHQYDLAISMEAYKKSIRTVVTNSILIKHFSYGTINKSWYKTAHIFYKTYKNILPAITNDYSSGQKKEISNFSSFSSQLIDQKMYKLSLYYFLQSLLFCGPKRVHFYLIKKLFKSCFQ